MADETPTPTPAPAPPGTPADVKRTPHDIKHPQFIALQKKQSELEDKVDSQGGVLDEIKGLLENLNIGGPPTPAKKIPVQFEKHQFKKKADDYEPAKGGFFSDVDKEIWGGN